MVEVNLITGYYIERTVSCGRTTTYPFASDCSVPSIRQNTYRCNGKLNTNISDIFTVDEEYNN